MPEYLGKSEDEKKALKLYRDTLAACVSYARPYFEQAVRFYRLYRGILPPEIDGTFSKVMINQAWSMVENEVPRSLRSVLTNPLWFGLDADDPSLEIDADHAQKWLLYQMERVQKIAVTSIPTVQSSHIFGNGYRVYSHKFKNKTKTSRESSGNAMGIPYGFRDKKTVKQKSIITGQYADYFTVFPIPGGGMVNAVDDSCSQMVPGVIWIDYMNKNDIESLSKNNPKWNKNEIAELFKIQSSDTSDVTAEFKDKLSDCKGGWYNFKQPEWMSLFSKDDGIERRYRVGWMWLRHRWVVVAEDRFLLYDGPPLIEDCIPLANFKGSFDLNEWWGIGLIEMTEDLILSIILNLNHRLDYLAGTLHPTTWVSERIMQYLGGDKSVLDPEPYGVQVFPTNANLAAELSRERFHDISPQAFVEDDKMTQWLQIVTGQPNYSTGTATPAPDNATGIISLIAEGAARSYLRAINLENTGLLDSLWLTMKFGAKYITDDEVIKISGQKNGWPWMNVSADAITDEYSFNISGTRDLNLQAETFRKMFQIVTGLISQPGLADNPKEAARQMLVKAGCFENVDEIIGKNQPMSLQGEMPGAEPGGMPTLENQQSSVENRMTVQPSTGRPLQVA